MKTMQDFINFLREAEGKVTLHFTGGSTSGIDEWEAFLRKMGVLNSEMKGCRVDFTVE